MTVTTPQTARQDHLNIGAHGAAVLSGPEQVRDDQSGSDPQFQPVVPHPQTPDQATTSSAPTLSAPGRAQTSTTQASFYGHEVAHDKKSGQTAYLTKQRRIAVIDPANAELYDYDTFSDFAEDYADMPRFVKAVARALGTSDPPATKRTPTTRQPASPGPQTTVLDDSWLSTQGEWAAGDPLVSQELAVLAERVHALEEFRIACENQHRSLTDTKPHKDGLEKFRGQKLPSEHPVALCSSALAGDIKRLEDEFTKLLEKEIKRSPLGPWIRAQKGLGPKTIARLLGAIGDPYWNDLHNRPRTVSELWAFSGYRPGQRLRKGQKANWSPAAKMRTHVIAAPIKQMIVKPCYTVYREPEPRKGYIYAVHVDDKCTCSPWRVMYDEARDKYRDSVHPESCAQCGPSGSPALSGSPRSDGHLDAMALRVVKKAILKELWREAKRLHELPGGHIACDTQVASAAGVPS
jgi:hypothetical protein